MAHIEKRRGKYRARFRRPARARRSHARSRRKADAERFLREVEADTRAWSVGRPAQRRHAARGRGRRSSCRCAAACRRRRRRRTGAISIGTSCPRFGAYRLGQSAGRRDRELAQRRDRRRHRAFVGAPPLPDAAAHAAGRRPEAEDPRQPVRPRRPAAGPEAGDGVPRLGRGDRARRGAPASGTGR